MKRAVAVIDGEHYAPVVRAALAELPYEFVGAYLVGGTEKLQGGEEYGLPLAVDLEEALESGPELVVDLSDEPVLGPRQRLRLASRVLARGLPYVGPDFRLEPIMFEPFARPSIAVIGTGKRVGKTAVTGYIARLFARQHDLIVVAMGRGGPPEPELAEVPPTVEQLLELAHSGRHAASDYLETAALAHVVTVGCRRCGGGLAGATAISNVSEGAALAASRAPELVLFDGSGAAVPSIATDRRVLVAAATQGADLVAGYLNEYRILLSDLVVLTMAEEGAPYEDVRRAIAGIKDVPVVAAVLRPRPTEPVAGKRVAFFGTAPSEAHAGIAQWLESEHGAEVVSVSGNLARREELRSELERIEAEVYLVEIKAAAIDVVAETAAERGATVVFADNDVLPLPGEADLDRLLTGLAEAARKEAVPG